MSDPYGGASPFTTWLIACAPGFGELPDEAAERERAAEKSPHRIPPSAITGRAKDFNDRAEFFSARGGGRKRRLPALVFRLEAGAALDEEADDVGRSAAGGRDVKRGVAGVVRRVDVESEIQQQRDR